MSRGKYLSLEEARQSDAFKRFCIEHPSQADRERFLKLLMLMSQGALEGEETSPPGRGACDQLLDIYVVAYANWRQQLSI